MMWPSLVVTAKLSGECGENLAHQFVATASGLVIVLRDAFNGRFNSST